MWNRRSKLLISIYFLLIVFITKSKAQGFQLGLIGGVNLSELAGSDIFSYVGLHTGLKVGAHLKTRLNISTELVYSQAGEYVLPISYPITNFGKIHLNYLEIPLYLTYLGFPKEDFFQKKFSFGVAYTQLLSHKVEDILGKNISDQVIWDRRNSVIGLLGVSHHFNKNLELNFRAALGKNEESWAWTLSFRGIYNLGI